MAIIQSGITSDLLTIDTTSKAARVTLYDAAGNVITTLPSDVSDRAARLLGHVTVDSSVLPTNAATEATLAARLADTTFTGRINTQGQKTSAGSTPVVLASDQSTLNTLLASQAAASSVPTGVVSLGNSLGKVNVMKTGTLATTASTADQVILTYTVTAGKTFYLLYLTLFARLTIMAATATVFGTVSLENPSGTKLITDSLAGGAGASQYAPYMPAEPVPTAAGSVIRVVVTPSAVTAFTFTANLGGYEK